MNNIRILEVNELVQELQTFLQNHKYISNIKHLSITSNIGVPDEIEILVDFVKKSD